MSPRSAASGVRPRRRPAPCLRYTVLLTLPAAEPSPVLVAFTATESAPAVEERGHQLRFRMCDREETAP